MPKQNVKIVAFLGESFQTKKKDGSGLRKAVVELEDGDKSTFLIYDKDIRFLGTLEEGQCLDIDLNYQDLVFIAQV